MLKAAGGGRGSMTVDTHRGEYQLAVGFADGEGEFDRLAGADRCLDAAPRDQAQVDLDTTGRRAVGAIVHYGPSQINETLGPRAMGKRTEEIGRPVGMPANAQHRTENQPLAIDRC